MSSRLSTQHSTLKTDTALIIFAKAPIPGQVKTRLCPPLTPDEAASLHGSFVLDALERSQEAGRHGSLTVERFLACAPPADHVFFKIMEERQKVRLLHQTGDDLGARMDQVFPLTRTKAEALGLKTALLPPCRDVDTLDDLLALVEQARLEVRGTRLEAKGKRHNGAQSNTSSPSPLAPCLSLRTTNALRLLTSRLKSRTRT